MRRSLMLLGIALQATSIQLQHAAEPADSVVALAPDPLYSRIDAEFHVRFPGATVLKVERKENDHITGNLLEFTVGIAKSRSDVFYKLTIADALNKKYDIVFDSSAELVATDKYKTTFENLPQYVQSAIGGRSNSGGSSDPLDAKLEKGVFKVWGKLDGKKISVEIPALAQSAKPSTSPADVVNLAQKPNARPQEPAPDVIEHPVAPLAPTSKAEIAAAIDGPFRAMFPDATILHVDHKDHNTNVTVHVFSIGGGDSKYELTLADSLNKKFKVVYNESGQLIAASSYLAPFSRLPRSVQAAIEQTTAVPDRSVVLEVRVEHKTLLQAEHEEYKVSGKINGVKVSVEVPVYLDR